ncbi:M48 family metallopeptidase [Bacteroidota bacterium]
MRKSLIRDLIILLTAALAIWAVFTIFPIIPDESDIDISIEQEEKLGNLIVENILNNNPLFKQVHNEALDSSLNNIMLRLEKGIGPTDYDYKIIVFDSPTINAAALPGGYILIFSELIKVTDNPEELTAVLAHEIAHIEKRHVIARLIKELGLSILTSGDSMVLAEVFKYTTSTAFDRRQEREADEFALKLLENSQVHPFAIASIFRKFKEKSGSYNEIPEILSTHPHNNSRIKAALKYEVDENFKSKKFDIDWERVKSVL